MIARKVKRLRLCPRFSQWFVFLSGPLVHWPKEYFLCLDEIRQSLGQHSLVILRKWVQGAQERIKTRCQTSPICHFRVENSWFQKPVLSNNIYLIVWCISDSVPQVVWWDCNFEQHHHWFHAGAELTRSFQLIYSNLNVNGYYVKLIFNA